MKLNNPYPYRTENEDTTKLEIEPSFVRYKTMVTPNDVIQMGLVGLPKVFPLTKEPITVEYVTQHLQTAIADLEMSGMLLSPITMTVSEDWHEGTFLRFSPTLLKKYPVTAIEEILLMYPHTTSATPYMTYRIPADWVTFEYGKVNILPSSGTVAPTLQSGAAGILPLSMWNFQSYKPSAIRIVYRAGFEQDKLPVNVWQLIVDMATYSMLIELGPLLFPNSSVSVGIDNVSQSANLPGPRMLLDRITALKLKIMEAKKRIAGYYAAGVIMEFAGL